MYVETIWSLLISESTEKKNNLGIKCIKISIEISLVKPVTESINLGA